jgi:Bacterial Ig-like domain (group 3)/Galactose oxidase, central domain
MPMGFLLRPIRSMRGMVRRRKVAGSSTGALALVVVIGLSGLTAPASATNPPNTWTQLSPANSPPVRDDAAMAYDPATNQLLLFGGQGTTGYLGDTWSWNGTTWTQLSPANSPSARYGAAMAYDAATGQLILFGGNNIDGNPNDTWSWNGTTWTQLSPATSPPGFDSLAMAYDDSTDQLVLVGNSTWTWNGSTWSETAPGGDGGGGKLAYDASSGQLIWVVGRVTYNWTGTAWAQLNPGARPESRSGTAVAYDPAIAKLLLFGGYINEGQNRGVADDTWTWSGSNWTKLAPATNPSARYGSTMGYDAATDQLVLFGGNGISTYDYFNDTWEYGVPPPAPTTTTASVEPTSATHGESVTYSATVTATTGTPTGTVDFTIGSNKLCSATLSAGATSCNATKAPIGTDSITATYVGSTAFASSSGMAILDVS